MNNNPLKEKFILGQKSIGALFSLNSPSIAEILGKLGLDFIIIDTEHGPESPSDTVDLIRACELVSLAPIVRVPQAERSSILKMLEIGAMGIVVPNIKTCEEVKNLVSWSKYSPLGERGCGLNRKNYYGLDEEFSTDKNSYFSKMNDNVLLLPQCETKESLECIEDIVAIPGVDGIFLGPFDLSIALGIPAQFDNPVFQSAMQRVVKACKGNNKICITLAGPTKSIAFARYDMGFDALISEDTTFLANGAKNFISDMETYLMD